MTADPTETVVLPAKLDAEAAADLLTAARSLNPTESLTVDASGVESMDASCVLALANIATATRAQGGLTAVLRPTDVFVDAFTDLGLFEAMMKLEFRT